MKNKQILLFMEFDKQLNIEIKEYHITFDTIIEALMDEIRCATYTPEKVIGVDLMTGETITIYE